MKEGLHILFITLEGGTHLLAVYSSKQHDKMSCEHFYKQSDAIKFSSCLIRLSKQDTKKPIRNWASFQIFLPAVHIFPEVIPPLPSIKSPNNGSGHYLRVGHFSQGLHYEMERKLYVASVCWFSLLEIQSYSWFMSAPQSFGEACFLVLGSQV